MASNPAGNYADDFLEQILSIPSYSGSEATLAGTDSTTSRHLSSGVLGGCGFPGTVFPLGLSLDSGFSRPERSGRFGEDFDDRAASAKGGGRDSGHAASLFPAIGHLQPHAVPAPPTASQAFQNRPATPAPFASVPHQPSIRPRVRARRGQATDPHSIAERLRRERIAERMKALQELVPSSNKTDKAAMLDEIVDYVKFLRLQVKVLSMSRIGGTGAVAHLIADIPLPSAEGGGSETEPTHLAWDKWLGDGTEQEVAKLMGEDVGAAMQYLQSKALCIMPISLAAAIYPVHQSDGPTLLKTESRAPL